MAPAIPSFVIDEFTPDTLASFQDVHCYRVRGSPDIMGRVMPGEAMIGDRVRCWPNGHNAS